MKGEDEFKARLMAEMEAEIEKLLGEAGDRREVTLTDIERVAGEAGRRIEQQIAQSLVEEAAQVQGEETMKCPECGGKLHYKGQKTRWVATASGEVKLRRGYFYCEACGKGIFPPGSALEAD
jgi:DNA-directed RNA polymerase subunit RPC12/RpoP